MKVLLVNAKKVIKYIIVVLACLIVFATIIFIYLSQKDNVKAKIKALDLEEYDNLMIVAHPDDDILWGGAHLIDDNYLVVCITCGPNKERVKEFQSVMDATEDKYLMLGYPDKNNKGERDNWEECREDLEKDLKYILEYKDWNLVVTHNPDGEYGHIHHKMANDSVTRLTVDKSKLYYFGKYYSKSELASIPDGELIEISAYHLNRKQEIIDLYESQSFIKTKFNHMNMYEAFIKYSEWEY